MQVADQAAIGVMSALGLGNSDDDTDEVIERLLRIPTEDLWQKIPPTIQFVPVVDGDIIPEDITFPAFKSKISTITSCKQIMLGDSQLDVGCFS
jgi:hypothetical protein